MAKQRDEKGRFVKGHGGGPGRPPKKREERYWKITTTACTFTDWRKIVKKAVEQAKDGDRDARKWLSDYLLGPATKVLELRGSKDAPLEHIISIFEYGDADSET